MLTRRLLAEIKRLRGKVFREQPSCSFSREYQFKVPANCVVRDITLTVREAGGIVDTTLTVGRSTQRQSYTELGGDALGRGEHADGKSHRFMFANRPIMFWHRKIVGPCEIKIRAESIEPFEVTEARVVYRVSDRFIKLWKFREFWKFSRGWKGSIPHRQSSIGAEFYQKYPEWDGLYNQWVRSSMSPSVIIKP